MGIARITVGVDGSDTSLTALSWADALAARTGAHLTVVMAWHYPYVTTMPGLVAAVPPASDMDEATTQVLTELVGPVADGRSVEILALQGSPAAALLQAAEDADLLVVGSRGHSGLSRLVMGSTSHHCATHAPCSVAVVRGATPPLPEHPDVAVAVDGSEHSVEALAWALDHLDAGRLRAILSHDERVLDEPDIDRALDERLHHQAATELASTVEAAERRVPDAKVTVEPVVVAGDPRTSVLAEADGADLLVMGPRGRGGVAGLLVGSFTTSTLTRAPENLPLVIARRRELDAD